MTLFKHAILRTLAAAALVGFAPVVGLAAGADGHVEDTSFSFEGPFGKFDQHQLQRGLQVYQEVCSACHGLKFVSFRTLGDPGGPGLSEGQVKAFAQMYEVYDADKDEDLPAGPADYFPASSDTTIPDLSLMAKARAGFHGPLGTGINQFFQGIGGPEYIVALLTGYTGEEKEEAGETYYENTAYPGGWIKMAPPLDDEAVEFRDGHSNDLHHMSEDVATFLMWAAEPKMMDRKAAGLTAVFALIGLCVLLYLTNKKLWAPIKRKA